MRHAFGALSRVMLIVAVFAATALVPLAAHAQEVGASPGGTLTTGIPWLDKSLAILAAVGAVCSLLSHVVSPASGFGKVVSWMAGNFGKALTTPKSGTVTELRPPNGFARIGTLALLFVVALSGALACGFIRQELGATIAADEIDCADAALKSIEAKVQPQLAALFATATSEGLSAAEAQLIADITHDFGGTAIDALTCAASALARDYESAHAADAGFNAPSGLTVSMVRSGDDSLVYVRAKGYVARQTKRPR